MMVRRVKQKQNKQKGRDHGIMGMIMGKIMIKRLMSWRI
jgi:hypothetical protein